jgi:hypothetical protein
VYYRRHRRLLEVLDLDDPAWYSVSSLDADAVPEERERRHLEGLVALEPSYLGDVFSSTVQLGAASHPKTTSEFHERRADLAVDAVPVELPADVRHCCGTSRVRV